MKTFLCLASTAMTAALLLASPASAQPRETCLAYRDLDQIHAVDNRSAIATTRRDAYMINFRGYCQAMASAAYFILDDRFHGFCVRPGDRMEISEPAPACVVASVTHLHSVRIRDRR